MPPKELQPTTGNVFKKIGDDEYVPIGRITEVPEMVVPDELSENEMFDFQFPQEMTITVNISHMPYWILAIFGDTKSIPNNWLKMHGFPMKRKRYRKGRK